MLDIVDYTLWMMGQGRSAGAGAIIMPIVVVSLALGCAGALAMALTPALGRWLAPPPPEPRFADYLPFRSIDTEGNLHCRYGRVVRVWKLEGIDHGGADVSDRELWYWARTSWLDTLAVDAGEIEIVMMTVALPWPGGVR